MDLHLMIELSSPEDQWSQFQQTCAQILSRSEFVDCTLCCSDGILKSHRLLLASSSSYMYNVLSSTPSPTPCSHPMLFFKKVAVEDMKLALEFIYTGKTFVAKDKLSKLMSISHELGCTSLSKAIQKAIERCGVEIFRRKTGQNSNQSRGTTAQQSSRAVTASKDDNAPNQAPATTTSSLENVLDLGFSKRNAPPCGESEESSDPENPYNYQNNDIKMEPFDGVESDNVDSQCSTTSILRSKLTPSSSKRGSSTMTQLSPPKKVRSFSKTSVKPRTALSSSSAPEIFLPPLTGSRSEGSHSDASVEELANMNAPSHEEEEGDNNGRYEEWEHQDDDCDEDELPITVVDLKSLAEPVLETTQPISPSSGQTSQSEGLPANCPWCFQIFTSISLLQRHIKTHVGSYKPYSCNYCPASFARSAHLKRHIRTHTGEKPFVCAVCKKAFSRQDKLKTHLERHMQQDQQNSSASIPVTQGKGPISSTMVKNFAAAVNSGSNSPSLPYHFTMCSKSWSNGNDSNSNGDPDAGRASKTISLPPEETQITVAPVAISPSTTITPISSLPTDVHPMMVHYANQFQVEINN